MTSSEADGGYGFAKAGKQIVLAAERTTIGRDRNCELVIDDPTVSRFHAELYQWEGRYYLRDGDSPARVRPAAVGRSSSPRCSPAFRR